MDQVEETINELFICKCHNVEHQLIFSYNKDWEEVFVSVHLVPESNIFKRIWKALQYVFGHRSVYGHFDEFILEKDDAEKLQQVVNHLKK